MSSDLVLTSDERKRRAAAALEDSRRDRQRMFAEALESDRTLELPDRASLDHRWSDEDRRGLMAGLEDELRSEMARAEILNQRRKDRE